ncbi:MAG: translesion DNA synthesis-associated protein ImuA [Thauera sp.]|jgi:cell division inhibitor SulA/protein ImuA|nr:translesion DNA synthesis-associated protein ImuA [Thauera sp.]
MALPLRRAAEAGSLAATPAHDIAAALPAGSVWPASRLAQPPGPVLPTGFAALDAELPGGGWPAGALIELLAERPGVGELSLLLPLLGATPPGRWIVCLAPPLLPYAPALARAGVPLTHLLVVRPERREDLLWSARQALLSGTCACVLAWAPRIDNGALRRLQLAAEESTTPMFLFRPLATAAQASPAVLRLVLSAHPRALQVRILKRRGPPAAAALLLPRPATATPTACANQRVGAP